MNGFQITRRESKNFWMVNAQQSIIPHVRSCALFGRKSDIARLPICARFRHSAAQKERSNYFVREIGGVGSR
jgi:hypothetical protein